MNHEETMSILDILTQDARTPPALIGAMLGLPETDVTQEIERLESENIILKYSAIVNEEKTVRDGTVNALIEVKVTPQYQHGYEAIAQTLVMYPQVRSCYLMSGAYDYMLLVDGPSLREIARFVTEKLAVINGVISTSTHFILRKYKDNHVVFPVENSDSRQVVSP